MDFAETIEFSKKFPSCHPKIFKGFIEWGVFDTETEGYVVLTDSSVTNEPCLEELEEYLKSHKLKIDCGYDYSMISSSSSALLPNKH